MTKEENDQKHGQPDDARAELIDGEIPNVRSFFLC